mgnify:FL=1|jgi:hypothetical protein
MGSYYRTIKTKKLIALLVRSGFVSKSGAKHGKYEREGSVVIVPRHRSISPGTSKQICSDLEKLFGIDSKELNKLF